ncbi:MAG: hypothetical protein GX066_04470 [Clostridiaceae bacterium]|nr:hypothetical protein [Clostridiaceae bacterium]
MNDDNRNAVEEFIKFNAKPNKDKYLDIEDKILLTDEKAKEIIRKGCDIKSTLELKYFEKEKGMSTRQLERLTRISRTIILEA